MDTISVSLLLLVAFVAHARCAALQVFPDKPMVVDGEGLVLIVQPNDVPLKSCVAKLGARSWTFNEASMQGGEGVNYWGRGLRAGDCGIQIEHYTKDFAGTWRFTVQHDNLESNSAFVVVTSTAAPTSPLGETITTALGKLIVIKCNSKDVISCKLIAPHGEVIKEGTNDCTSEIPFVRIRDVGIWNCLTTLPGKAEEFLTEFAVNASDVKTLDIGITEDEGFDQLHCNLLTNGSLQYCQFELPGGKVLLLNDGSNEGRYTYSGNGIGAKYCGVAIQKPLVDDDIGVWSCKLFLKDKTIYGGFINVTKKSKSGIVAKQPKYVATGADNIMLLNGTSLTLRCSIREALKYCWFRHPNGTRFALPNMSNDLYSYTGQGLDLGECGMTLNVATVEDTGVWTCGMGLDLDVALAEDIQKTIGVVVSDTRIVVNRTITNAAEGDWVILACRSLFGEGLKYCSFVTPSGVGYSLTNRKPTKHDRYAYVGNGLANGDCGIIINPIKREDYGSWRCAAMLVDSSDGKEYYKDLIIKAPGFSTSSAIGIAVGLGIAVILGVGFLVYREKRKSNRKPRESTDPVLASGAFSDTSEEIDLTVRLGPSRAMLVTSMDERV